MSAAADLSLAPLLVTCLCLSNGEIDSTNPDLITINIPNRCLDNSKRYSLGFQNNTTPTSEHHETLCDSFKNTLVNMKPDKFTISRQEDYVIVDMYATDVL